MTEIQKIRELALTKGDPEDMWMCGCALMYGEFTYANGKHHKFRKNIPEAIEWLEKSSKAGCVGAMLELGGYYYKQKPRKRENLLHALHWAKLAWRTGDMDAANNLAMTYALLGRPRECHELMLRVIDSKDGGKDWRYGYALLDGNCKRWIGENVSFMRNEAEGIRILEDAASNGDSEAMLGLGNYYYALPGDRESNLLESLLWAKQAWRSGEVVAAQNIASTYMKLNQPSECHAWLKRGYRKCKWPVALSLAKACISGYGTKRNIDKAKEILHWISESEESHPSTRPQARRYLKALEAGKIPKLKQPI